MDNDHHGYCRQVTPLKPLNATTLTQDDSAQTEPPQTQYESNIRNSRYVPNVRNSRDHLPTVVSKYLALPLPPHIPPSLFIFLSLPLPLPLSPYLPTLLPTHLLLPPYPSLLPTLLPPSPSLSPSKIGRASCREKV